eukprot:128807_1
MAYKLQYYKVIRRFIRQILKQPKHSNIKCILLYFLMNEQYEYDGTFDVHLFIEFMRIPKRRAYNKRIFKYYDTYNDRYLQQKEKQKHKENQPNIAAVDHTVNDEGLHDNEDADGHTMDDEYNDLPEMKMIGEEVDWVTDYNASQYTFGAFGNIRNDQQLIKSAVQYFFQNPNTFSDGTLSNEIKENVSNDEAKFQKLSKHYKRWIAERRQLNIERLISQQFDDEEEDQKVSTDGAVNQSGTAAGGTDGASGDGEEDYEEDEEEEANEMYFVSESESYALVKLLIPYIDRDLLQIEQAEYELLSGTIATQSAAHRNLIKRKGLTYTDALKNKVMIEFDKSNTTKYAVSDECSVRIKIKNVNKLLLKVFKMKTTPYFQKCKSDIPSSINLEGLESSINKEIQITNYSSQFQVITMDIALPSLTDSRGLFFVDLIGNGLHARCIIRKGDVKYVESKTDRGHTLKLMDENHNVLLHSNVWMDGNTYASDPDTGDIFIPYAKQNAIATKLILQHNEWSDFSILADFQRLSQNFNLYTSFYVDRENLLEKMESFVVISNALYVNHTKVSIQKLLKDIELNLKITTLDGIQVNKLYKNIKVYDDRDHVSAFSLPNNATKLEFTLKCKVKLINGSDQTFTKTKSFQINKIDTTNDIVVPHLISRPHSSNNYFVIAVLGKNGEAVSGVYCKLKFKYYALKNEISVDSESGEDGIIYLPNLSGVTRLTIKCANHVSCFTFPMDKCLSPQTIHIEAHKPFHIPYFSPNNMNNGNMTYKLYDKMYSQEHVNVIEYNQGLFTCPNGLDAGSYILCGDYHQYECKIYVTQSNGEMMNRFCVENESETFTEINDNMYKPLQITDIKDTQIKLNTTHSNDLNRVHVFLTHRYPSFPVFNAWKTLPYCTKQRMDYKSSPSMYCKSRSISEEYRYVLERATADKFVGNLLKQPSLLLKPWSAQSTKTKMQEAAKGDAVEHKVYHKNRRIIQSAGFTTHHFRSLMAESGTYPNLEFLSKYPSKMILNLVPDKDGVVQVPHDCINPNHNFMTVVAVNDKEEWCIKTQSLSKHTHHTTQEDQTEEDHKLFDYYSDVRLVNGLEPTKHFTEQRDIILLTKGQTYKIENFKNCEYEILMSLRDIFNLFYTLSGNNTLNEFQFLLNWNKRNATQQMNKLHKYMCHEMNIYLYFKHREYFDRIIKPFLVHKMEKTFIDYYLIDDTEHILRYANEHFGALNAAEKILLAYKFKNDDEYKHIAHQTLAYFKEMNESLKIKPSKFKELFNKALTQRTDHKHVQRINMIASEINCESLPIFSEEKVSTDYVSRVPYKTQQMRQNRKQKLAKKAMLYNWKDADDEDVFDTLDEEDHESRLPEISSSLFQDLSECKEYQESNYYKISNVSTTDHLVPTNKFWCDFGQYVLSNSDQKDDDSDAVPFLSKYLFLATSSFTEMMIALSILDLPTDEDIKPNITKDLDTSQMEISCDTPCIIFCKELSETQVSTKRAITVSQHYFDPEDRYTTDMDGEKMDKFVECDAFETTKIYGCRAILSNPSSSSLNVECLYQIPNGSIPVHNGTLSKTEFIHIASYSCTRIEFYFYFPKPGCFTQFPVQISKKNKVLGFGTIHQIKVSLPAPSKDINTESWEDVSLNAKDHKDVLKYLENHNLYETDLKRIYWRLSGENSDTDTDRKKLFFTDLCTLLRNRKYYDSAIWQHAVIYQTKQELSEYIRYSNRLQEYLSPFFYSLWMEYDETWKQRYCHLEYVPFYNPRVHKLGTKRTILNNKLKKQYTLFLNRALHQSVDISSLSVEMLLQFVYYLLIQNRIKESLLIFKLINPNEASAKYSFQYDYFNAYLAFYKDNKADITQHVKGILVRYKHKTLPKSKRLLFNEIELQLTEMNDVDQKTDDLERIIQDQTHALEDDYTLDFAIRDRNIRFSYNQIKKVEINFYMMDIELLFSMSPFLQRGNNQSNDDMKNANGNIAVFSYIEPNESIQIELEEHGNDDVVQLCNVLIPKQLQTNNIYIEIRSLDPLGIVRPISSAFYDNNLYIQIKERYGILRVLNEEDMRPIPKAYCKVYAWIGYPKFHKDGYSDHRGQFDYVSVTCNHLKATTKFAVLICTKKYGSIVKIIHLSKDIIDRSDATHASTKQNKRKNMNKNYSRT